MDGFGKGPVLAASATSVTTPAVGSALVPQLETTPLPAGLPTQLNHPLAWTSTNFQDNSTYTHVVDAEGLAELRAAVVSFKTHNLDGTKVDCNNFPLPRLGEILSRLSQDVHNGRGFCVIRGVNPADFNAGDLTLVYLGIQAHIANERGRQDSKGNMLVHIVADNSATRTEHHRHSTKSITFHNEEGCDVVSWLTRSTAASGGKCIIASAYTVYNVLAATRPDLIRVLARSDWPFAMPRFQCRPIIFYRNSKLIMNFGRAPLLGNAAHPRPGHYPKITQHQLEALDAVEAIAQASQLEIKTQAGDMHFINNLAILHRREGFVDGAGQSEKRHLVRMWLRSSELGWAIPEELKREWSDAFEKEGRRVYHVEPMPERFFPLRIHPN